MNEAQKRVNASKDELSNVETQKDYKVPIKPLPNTPCTIIQLISLSPSKIFLVFTVHDSA